MRQSKPVADEFLSGAERLLMQLLALPGKSGEEKQVMDFITRRLRQAGVPQQAMCFDSAHRRSPYGGQIGNLILRLPGSIKAPRRMFVAHVDTVPLCQTARPVRRGGWIVPADSRTALGADDRAGAAVLLATALEIVKRRLPHPPLVFLWTVQEEVGLYGARNVAIGRLGKPRWAFNFDGSSPEKVTIGATGGYRMHITVHGKASHAGNAPEAGVNAIVIAAQAIFRLHADGWHGRVEKDGRLGTSNVGVIRGGDATNVVTPLVELRAEARSHDPEFRQQIIGRYHQYFREAADAVRSSTGAAGLVTIKGQLDYESFRLADDEPAILAAEAAIRHAGGQPQRAISDGGLDANWLTAHGIPTVSIGCGQENAHTAGERLNLEKFRMACKIAMSLATAAVE
jgi:tripeptide aminopeptidase